MYARAARYYTTSCRLIVVVQFTLLYRVMARNGQANSPRGWPSARPPIVWNLKVAFRDFHMIKLFFMTHSEMMNLGLGTPLFVNKVPRPEDSEGTFSVFESSCHLFLPVLPLKGRDNPIKCLAQKHNKRTCRPISTLTLLNAERQAGVYRLRGERSNHWATTWHTVESPPYL